MPGSGARKIELSEVQPQILEQLVRQRHREHGLVNRAPIILGAAAGHRNADIGGKLNQQRLSVRRWRQRWSAAGETVAAVEGAHDEGQALCAVIEQGVPDAWRSGRPDTFSAEG